MLILSSSAHNVNKTLTVPLKCSLSSTYYKTFSCACASNSRFGDVNVEPLLEWAKTSGIKGLNVRPAMFADGLRGMKAVADIKAGDLILSVPRQSAVYISPRQRCPFPDFIKPEYWTIAPWFIKLALMILHQKRQTDAPLAGYIEELPEHVELPFLWDDDVLQSLQYPHLIHQIKEQRAEWVRIHEAVTQRGLQPGQDAITQQELYWAMSCVRSRTFSGPYVGSTLRARINLALIVAALVLTNATLGLADLQQTLTAAAAVFIFNILYELILSRSAKQYAMCPLIDLINHSSTVESEVSYDYVSDSFIVTASKDYKIGDQIFVDYGQNNDGLMQYYGFSESNNAKDVYMMSNLLKWLEEVLHTSQKGLDALNDEGLLSALQIVTVERSGFSSETLQAIRFLIATSPSPDPSSTSVASTASSSNPAASSQRPSSFSAPGDAALESRLAAVLVHACNRELGSLGTSIQEDTYLEAGSKRRGSAASSSVAADRIAVAFRLEKKRVLISCLKNLGVDYEALTSESRKSDRKAGTGRGFA